MQKSLLFIILFIFLFTSVIAPPKPTTVQATEIGLLVAYPKYDYVRVNTSFELHFHVFNISTGLMVTNETTDCYVHLYDISGDHSYQNKSSFSSNGFDYELDIPTTAFAQLGQNAYIIQCNSTSEGGFASGSFYVTESGTLLLDENYYSIYALIFVSVLLYLMGFSFGKERWKLKSFFYIMSLLSLVILVSTIMIFNGNNSLLYNLSLSTFILILSIVSFYFLYILIYYTIEILTKLRKAKEKKRSEKSDPY